MFSGHFEEVAKAVDTMKIFLNMRTPQKEECLKTLATFSRFVTPCPDIVNQAFDEGQTITERQDERCTCNDCEELSSECSDESLWETVDQQQQSNNSNKPKWKNLLEYEKSLLRNSNCKSTVKQPSVHRQPNNLPVPSSSHKEPTAESGSATSSQNVVKSLDSIEKSLQRLETQRSSSTLDKFGMYISHRLNELSAENRALAEIEINKILMKYVAKQIQEEQLTDTLSDDSEQTT